MADLLYMTCSLPHLPDTFGMLQPAVAHSTFLPLSPYLPPLTFALPPPSTLQFTLPYICSFAACSFPSIHIQIPGIQSVFSSLLCIPFNLMLYLLGSALVSIIPSLSLYITATADATSHSGVPTNTGAAYAH